MVYYSTSRSGEIGRRSGLKIHRVQAHAGSSPAFGTILLLLLFKINLYDLMEAFNAFLFSEDYQAIYISYSLG